MSLSRLSVSLTAALILCTSAASHAAAIDDTLPVRGTHLEDITFHSQTLNRDVTYRVIAPQPIPPGKKLSVLWLFHGAKAGYTNWSKASNIADLARRGVLLVMPGDEQTLWTNNLAHPDQNYDDFFINELLPNVHEHFPSADTDRTHNALIGTSRGAFGAMVIGLRHPDLFSYIGSLSGAFEIARPPLRPESAAAQLVEDMLGPVDSPTRKASDPYELILTARPLPYFYLACGWEDPLLPFTQNFAKLLKSHNVPYELHSSRGDHDWNYWNGELTYLEKSLRAHGVIA